MKKVLGSVRRKFQPWNDPAAKPFIEFRDVSKVFESPSGPIRAVDGVDLSLEAGEVTGVVGPSGAGKSTLVRLITGLERVTSGQLVVDGSDVATLSERQLELKRRDIGMIFQQFNLFSSRTVAGNVAFPLKGDTAQWLARAQIEAFQGTWRGRHQGVSHVARACPEDAAAGIDQQALHVCQSIAGGRNEGFETVAPRRQARDGALPPAARVNRTVRRTGDTFRIPVRRQRWAGGGKGCRDRQGSEPDRQAFFH